MLLKFVEETQSVRCEVWISRRVFDSADSEWGCWMGAGHDMQGNAAMLRAESWERGLLYWRWTFEKMSRGAARKTQRRKKTDEIRARRHMRAVFFVKVEHFLQSSLLENLSQGSVALSQNKFGQCVIHHIRKTNFLRASWSWRWGNGGRLSWWRKLWSGSSVVVAA